MSIEIDEIIRSNRRTIALVVTADAKLIVRAPHNTPTDYIKDLEKKGEMDNRKNRQLHAAMRFIKKNNLQTARVLCSLVTIISWRFQKRNSK